MHIQGEISTADAVCKVGLLPGGCAAQDLEYGELRLHFMGSAHTIANKRAARRTVVHKRKTQIEETGGKNDH